MYNDISGTYDARHSKMTAEEFKKYILNLRQCRLTIPNDIFMGLANKNPFASIENPIEKEAEGKGKERSIKNVRRL